MSVSVDAAKTCSQCETPRPLSQFPSDRRRRDGRGSKCFDCTKSNKKAYYARYPEREAERRLKQAGHGANWYQRNRETQLERMRWNATKRKYGVGKEEYERLLSAQDGVCAICGSSDPGRKDGYFTIDHCHTTNGVRGLTCHPCNVGLGMFRDDPTALRKAALYLKRARRDVDG